MFVMFETCSTQDPGATPASPALFPDACALLEALHPAQSVTCEMRSRQRQMLRAPHNTTDSDLERSSTASSAMYSLMQGISQAYRVEPHFAGLGST